MWQGGNDSAPTEASAVLTGEAAGDIELSWTESDEVLTLRASELPPVGDDVYQLWLVMDDGVVSAGVFRPAASGEVNIEFPVAAGDASAFAVTIEPGPSGSPAATTDAIYEGEPSA